MTFQEYNQFIEDIISGCEDEKAFRLLAEKMQNGDRNFLSTMLNLMEDTRPRAQAAREIVIAFLEGWNYKSVREKHI